MAKSQPKEEWMGGRESGMFFYDKTQLLDWPGCTYADANQFLEFQTGKAC